MPPLPDRKHEAFCRAYVRGPNAGNLADAYEAAGFARDYSNAARLHRKPDILERINELLADEAASEREAMSRVTRALAIDRKAVLGGMARLGFSNIFDYVRVDAAGRMTFDMSRVDRDKGTAIRELAFEQVEAKDDSQPPTMRVRVRMFDKRQALADLARCLGMFSKRPGYAMSDEFAELTPQQIEDKLAANLAMLDGDGVDIRALIDRAVPPPAPSRDVQAPAEGRGKVEDEEEELLLDADQAETTQK
jgi:hypothetical protein